MSDVLERLRNIVKAARHGTSELVRRETLCDAVAELTDVSAELDRTRALCWEAQNQRDEARRERDGLREVRKHLERRIERQRSELRYLDRLVADQRAAMAAEGIQFMEAERWAAAVRERDEARAEVARLMPLALAVGECGCTDVPVAVAKAYIEPEGYRADEIHRLREELAAAEGRANNLERQIRYLLERAEHGRQTKDRSESAARQPAGDPDLA